MTRKLLVLDTSYAYEAILARKLQDSVTCRDLGGFFEHVWTVHPFASLVTEGSTKELGEPETHSMNDAHTFIDGKIGRFDALRSLPLLNFAASQADLIARLGALIRREKISAIRSGDPLYNGLLGLALARRHKIPLAIRVNANFDKMYESTGKPAMPRFFRSRAIEKRVIRFVLSRADLVAAVNQDNLDFAISNGARPERSTIFRYGNLIDKRHVAEPASRDLGWGPLAELWPERVRFLLHVGRLETVKKPDDPIKVLAELRRRGHDVNLVMVGDGRERSALEALARDLGIASAVRFTGNRDQEWLSRVIPQATAVLSPITGRALSEAAFGAAPIVAYDLDWQGELVRTNDTGELVAAFDVAAMADATEKYLSNEDYARRMGTRVRQEAFRMLDPATLDAHERAEYEKLLARVAREKNVIDASGA